MSQLRAEVGLSEPDDHAARPERAEPEWPPGRSAEQPPTVAEYRALIEARRAVSRSAPGSGGSGEVITNRALMQRAARKQTQRTGSPTQLSLTLPDDSAAPAIDEPSQDVIDGSFAQAQVVSGTGRSGHGPATTAVARTKESPPTSTASVSDAVSVSGAMDEDGTQREDAATAASAVEPDVGVWNSAVTLPVPVVLAMVFVSSVLGALGALVMFASR